MLSAAGPGTPGMGLIDHRALNALADGVAGDQDSIRCFIHDFISLWDTRAERLMKAIACRSLDAVHVVLLSIRTSAGMLGALPLEHAAVAMLRAVKQADLVACAAQAAELIELGAQTCIAFSEQLTGAVQRRPA